MIFIHFLFANYFIETNILNTSNNNCKFNSFIKYIEVFESKTDGQ